MISSETPQGRRRFLNLLAGSPLLAYAGLPPGLQAILGSGGRGFTAVANAQEGVEAADA